LFSALLSATEEALYFLINCVMKQVRHPPLIRFKNAQSTSKNTILNPEKLKKITFQPFIFIKKQQKTTHFRPKNIKNKHFDGFLGVFLVANRGKMV